VADYTLTQMDDNKKPVKQVLYITYDGLTDPLGQSQIIPYLRGLTPQGFRFTILSFEKPERFARERAVIEKIVQENDIAWVPLTFTSRPPVLSKMYDLWQMKRKAVQLHKAKQFDLVHCRSYVPAEAGMLLKRKFGVKFLFDMRGFWVDERIDAGQWKLSNPLQRYFYNTYKKKEKQFLQQADHVISLTHAGEKALHGQPDYARVPITVIPCCADLDHFNYERVDATKQAALRSELGIAATDKILIYLGSMGGWYLGREMMQFYKMLHSHVPQSKFLIVTKDDPQLLYTAAVEAGVPKEQLIIRYSPRESVPLFISLANWSVFFIKPSYSKTASSPTKQGELMAMGVPVICNDIGDSGHIIRDTGAGAVVAAFTDAAFENVIVNELPQLEQQPRSAIRQSAFKYYDLADGVQQYRAVYAKMGL
jgi:glycosyltransferase involved in cell wall biosynthesis